MTRQGSLFAPGSANREEPIQAVADEFPFVARLLARTADPVTSKQAARRVGESGRLSKGQIDCLAHIRAFGPGTTWEIALRHPWVVRGRVTPESLHYLMARRLPELERKGLVRVQQDPSKPCRCKPNAKRCRCRDVVRDGSRCWEVVS